MGSGAEKRDGSGEVRCVAGTCTAPVVSFPDPAFKLDKHFTRNLGLADSALPEIWRTNQIADHVVRIALPKRTLESCN